MSDAAVTPSDAAVIATSAAGSPTRDAGVKLLLLTEDDGSGAGSSNLGPTPVVANSAPKGPFLFRGMLQDLRHRAPLYGSDWTEGLGFGLLRPATYIFLASVVPALAFGEQLVDDSHGIMGGSQVLIATAMCGGIQAIFGGQPLLIVGVAEPIILVYHFMYKICDDNDIPFNAFSSVTLFWAAGMIFILAALNACSYIHSFTRFSGELFGLLISVLFIQQGVKGLIAEYDPSTGFGASKVKLTNSPSERNFSGTWALFLAFGLVWTSFKLRQARGWFFFNGIIRGMIADYSTAIMVIMWTGISYACSNTPDDIPRRLVIEDALESAGQTNWHVLSSLDKLSSDDVWLAAVPAFVITILFFFDHNVSAQLAQVREFNLKKPHAYHWDFFLLGIMTLVCGLCGVPPVNGVIPQAPLHTENCGEMVKDKSRPDGKPVRVTKEQRWTNLIQALLVMVCIFIQPVIKTIPRSVLWGFFIYMGLEALEGSQLWERIQLLVADKRELPRLLKTDEYAYLDGVAIGDVHKFTLFQLFGFGVCYGVTWAGSVGIAFPLLIMAVVPARKNLFPKFFKASVLRALDPLEHEHDVDEYGDEEDADVYALPSGSQLGITKETEI